MTTTVVNVSNPDHARYNAYIGRIRGSHGHFGNPFIIGRDGSRDEVIVKCDQWLNGLAALQTIEPGRRRWIRMNLPRLKDMVIGCHCEPEACHGHVYVRMLDVEAIWGFHMEPYICLSNFSEHPVVYNNIQYQTAEHAFQAAKAANQADHDFIASSVNPAEAKRRGRRINRRPDFEESKIGIMAIIVYSKVTQHPDVRQTLMDTGSALLIEGNWWGDKLWGMVKNTQTGFWEGENLLGRTLELTRDIFRLSEKMGLGG